MSQRKHWVSILSVVLAVVGLLVETALPVHGQGASTLDQIKSRGSIRIGWGVWFPYMYRDAKTQELSGVTVEVFGEMAKELRVKAEFVEDSWATLVAGLQAGKFDVTLPLVITPARAEVVTFTRPVTKTDIGVIVRKEDLAQYSTWQDLDKPDKKVSTTLGSAIQPVAQARFTKAQVLLVKAGPDSIAQVLSGRADAWVNDYDAFRHVLKEHAGLAVVPGPALGAQEVAFAVRKGDQAFQEWINRFIGEQRANGNLLRIIAKHGLTEMHIPK
jgi:ABC-type amino acid transport substrate-binding protein